MEEVYEFVLVFDFDFRKHFLVVMLVHDREVAVTHAFDGGGTGFVLDQG